MATMRLTFVVIAWGLVFRAGAEDRAPADFQPDPLSVQRYGPAYRYPQAGWIVLHIEGEPYERGYQHGRLLANEIAAYLRCSAAMRGHKAPAEAWNNTRTLVNALFLRRYDKEYLEEMKGIADGATAGGAKFEGRPVDLVDVVAMNAWPEIETLDSALEATATGLEGIQFPHEQPRAMPPDKPMHCSAFAATGPATADGKIVFGHITMFGLYPSLFYNVWIDIKPAKGHRVSMQTFPGGMNSGMDYYLNNAGLMVSETTIAQTRFDITGKALASRIRTVMQYADSIDKAVEILKDGNNGLYTNEWLLGDAKTNEIAMFELGTHKSKLFRSSKNEWFGGAEGFYWGCNNAKDLQVRLETIASVNGTPANMVWRPSDRDQMWLRLYRENKGKIDVEFGKRAFTTPPVAAYHSLDAKFTTTDMAKGLRTWALFGPPLGRAWEPTNEERGQHPEVRAMVSNPWTVLHSHLPSAGKPSTLLAVDLSGEKAKADAPEGRRRRRQPARTPVWHGTILPKTDADIWLAAAFAEYERFVSEEQVMRGEASDGLSADERRQLGLRLFAHRSTCAAGALTGQDTPLSGIQPEFAQGNWYKVASGKGVCVLHELRQLMGDEPFKKMMDSFGRKHAGRPAGTEEFQQHVANALSKAQDGSGKSASFSSPEFFTYWTTQPGFPILKLASAECRPYDGRYRVHGEITAGIVPAKIDITVESENDEVVHSVLLDGSRTTFEIDSPHRPKRLVVDKYGWTAKADDPIYSTRSFFADLDHTLIVYGTADEEPAQREAAERLQRRIREYGSNKTLAIRADRDTTDEDLKSNHILLIGRPDSNRLVGRFQNAFPVKFGPRSFTVDTEAYGHAGSALIAAAPNPLNPRYSAVLLAGLSAESTWHTPENLFAGQSAEVLVFPANGKSKALVIPRPELVRNFSGKEG
jgi:hypothetical protein